MGAARHSTRVEKLFLEIVNVAIFCPISHDVGEQPGPHSSEKRAAAQGKAEPISHDLSGDEPLRSPHAAPLLPLRRVGSPLSGSHRGGRCSGSPPSLHTRRTLWRRCGPSEVPRRQPEQRWSLAMDGAKQPDPRAREKRVVTQRQSGWDWRKAARTAGSASYPAVQCDPCPETGRPGEIGCRKKDDRGERAGRSELVRELDGRHDLRADSERERGGAFGTRRAAGRAARTSQ